MGFSVSSNSPSLGFISWVDAHVVYEGVDYPIANGNTSKKFVFWTLSNPKVFQVSDSYPALTPDDCIVFLNKGGIPISVLTSTAMDGDLVVPGTVTSTAIATDAIDSTKIKSDAIIARHILAGAITAEKLSVEKLSAITSDIGSVTAGDFTLDADGYIRGGAVNYGSGTGFWMGYDNGSYKFRAGTPGSSRMEWDGKSFNIYAPNGDMTMSSGVVDYVKLANQPQSLGDISKTEGEKLSTVEAGATRNVYRGLWALGTAYAVGDSVIDDDGYGWACTVAHTAAADKKTPIYPAASNGHWAIHGVKGEDAILGRLTNGNATISASHDGTVDAASLAAASGVFEVYKGVKQITPSSITFSVLASTGCTGTIDARGNYSVTSMVDDTATLDLRATYLSVNQDCTLTLSKSRAGTPATSYWITPSSTAVTRDASGKYVEPSVKFSAFYQAGSATPASYLGRFTIDTTIDGVNFSSNYISLDDESSVTFSLPEGIKSIRARLYENGPTDQLEFQSVLDEQSVLIVEDGIKYTLTIESSNGTVFRVGQAKNTRLIARVFRNGVEVTDQISASKFKWTRTSLEPREPPFDDATWNSFYQAGYKQIQVMVDDVQSKATFHCEITQ